MAKENKRAKKAKPPGLTAPAKKGKALKRLGTAKTDNAENKKSTETSKSWCGRKIAKVLIAFYYLI